ncbi:MAG: hypothetical protein GXX96_35410 [Planctomycetaceae bacterium]|nr:hypothetical protein [Planctomycetaceae bacterium]
MFTLLGLMRSELSRPDFVLSTIQPTETNFSSDRSLLVGDVKLAMSTIIRSYKKSGGTKLDQFKAMNLYASNHGTRVVLLIALARNAGKGYGDAVEETLIKEMLLQMGDYKNVIVVATIFDDTDIPGFVFPSGS